MNRIVLLIIIGMVFGVLNGLAQPAYKQHVVNYTQVHKNPKDLLPLKDLSGEIAVVVSDKARFQSFVNACKKYAKVQVIQADEVLEQSKYYKTLLVLLSPNDPREDWAEKFGYIATRNMKNVVLIDFDEGGSPLVVNDAVAHIQAKSYNEKDQQQAALTIFGGLASTQGVKTKQTRIQYFNEEFSGINRQAMESEIDLIASEAIREKATPGLVVMVIKNGQVVFEKAYGYHTYENKRPTHTSDIFDLASISKIVGTTPVVMHLEEQGVIKLDDPLKKYIYESENLEIGNTQLRTILLHEAGFIPYIPFYRDLNPNDVSRFYTSSHQLKMADSSFLINGYYQKHMWPKMLEAPLKTQGKYVYSDISLYVMQEVVERMKSKRLDVLASDFLFEPMGMFKTGYLPRERFSEKDIVPTENDTSFRKVLLKGYVHDQGAAMAGGVAGHAGLFSTAGDLAMYGQMLLNRGEYGGKRFFKAETVDKYSSKQSSVSRRGLGFDRHDPNPELEYPSKMSNESVYGHTGYTGTCIWIDPQNQLVYIFLSNRVHPQVSTKILELNTRSRIQDAIYKNIQSNH